MEAPSTETNAVVTPLLPDLESAHIGRRRRLTSKDLPPDSLEMLQQRGPGDV
jgi:hypothetical protein